MSNTLEYPEGTLTLGPVVELRWNSGRVQRLEAATLRALCPCELCRTGAIKLEKAMFPGLVAQSANLVGAYALQFIFSDGHKHGAYSYDFLEKLPDAA